MNKIDVTIQQLRLSVSKAKTFADCKKKFKYTYIEKIPTKDYEHLTFGSFVHKILEEFHKYFIENNDPQGIKTKHSFVMNLACKIAFKEFKHKLTKQMKEEVYDLMKLYLKNMETKFPNVLFCEKDFDYKFPNNIELKGFIDRIDILDDGVIKVSDYKTSKSDKYLINDPFQLLTYSFILLKENPELEKIKGSYIMVRDNFSEIEFEFKKDEILEIEDKFLSYAVDIRKEEIFKSNPTILCNWCSFSDICQDGQKMLFNKTLTNGEVDW